MKKLPSITAAMLILFFIALSIAIATFVEKNHTTNIAFELFYASFWFELFFYLLFILITLNIFYSKMYLKPKLPLLLIHLSLLCIITGGLITKHISFKGDVFISKNTQSNTLLARDYSMKVTQIAKKENIQRLEKQDNNKYTFTFNDRPLQIVTKYYHQFIQNDVELLKQDAAGVIDFEILNKNLRERYLFEAYGRVIKDGVEIAFNKEPLFKDKPYIKIVANEHQMIHFISNVNVRTNFDEVYEANKIQEIHPGIVYTIDSVNILIDKVFTIGKMTFANSPNQNSHSALVSSITFEGERKNLILHEQGEHFSSYTAHISFKNADFKIEWEKEKRHLPFNIQLNAFSTLYYPGSNVASSYESHVTLKNSKDSTPLLDGLVQVNEPLTYKGYFLYQTNSNINDAILIQVNYNPAIWLIYIGYLLLSIGLFLQFFNPSSRYAKLNKELRV